VKTWSRHAGRSTASAAFLERFLARAMAAPKVARQMAAHDPPCQPGETAPASWELAPELQSSREPLARMDAALDAPDEWTKESVLKWGHAHYGKNAWSRQAWSAWADEQLAVHQPRGAARRTRATCGT